MGLRILTYEETIQADMMGQLFEDSLDLSPLSSPLFIRYFMNSEVSLLYKELVHQYTSITNKEIVERIQEGKKANKVGVRYGKDEMHWIGYCYLAIMRIAEMSPKAVYRLFPSKKMWECYPIYHTFSIETAVDRLFEDNGYKLTTLKDREKALLEDSLLKEGVI